MSETFTNRRGKKVTDPEALQEVAQEHYEVTVPEKPAKQLRKSPKKRSWVWLVAGLGLLVLIFIVLGEVVAGVYRASVDKAKQGVRTVASEQLVPFERQTSVSAAELGDVTTQYRNISSAMCPGGLLDNVASLYPNAASALRECALYRTKVETLAGAVGGMQSVAAYLEKLPAVLGSVTQPSEDQFAVLASQQENWQAVSDGLKGLTPPVELQSVHSALLSTAGDINSGWTKLMAATSSQDGGQFAEVQSQLKKTYDAFRSQADALQAAVWAAQDRLTAAADGLGQN